jgi:hypothetical protein
MLPENYESWRRCIVEKCGIPLTLPYIQRRLRELRSSDLYDTQRFIDVYGILHYQRIVGWFEQALEDKEREATLK